MRKGLSSCIICRALDTLRALYKEEGGGGGGVVM